MRVAIVTATLRLFEIDVLPGQYLEEPLAGKLNVQTKFCCMSLITFPLSSRYSHPLRSP